MPAPVATRPDRISIIGVLNVTPDSFSDGGLHPDLDTAIAHARQLRSEGADYVDVGGESTRPGAYRIDADEEMKRVLPVISELAAAGVPVSIDTYRARVADAALEAGAVMVNDVSGGLADPAMVDVVRAAGCPWSLMHWRAHADHMQDLAVYDDVVADVCRELQGRIDAALAAGIDESQLIVDPGLGFAKKAEHNWALLAALPTLMELGPPLLVAASRKSFLGRLLADSDGTPRDVHDREDATVAITAHCAALGVWGVRVHEVRRSADAALAVRAIASVTHTKEPV